jgi:hypothetical protein
MRNLTEELEKLRQAALMDEVRAVVREEIARAFQAFRREAERYDGGEIRDMAADALATVLDGTVTRLTCPHEKYQDWGFGPQPQCARCGEPEPQPVNPFEPHEHTHDISDKGEPTDCIICGAPYSKDQAHG